MMAKLPEIKHGRELLPVLRHSRNPRSLHDPPNRKLGMSTLRLHPFPHVLNTGYVKLHLRISRHLYREALQNRLQQKQNNRLRARRAKCHSYLIDQNHKSLLDPLSLLLVTRPRAYRSRKWIQRPQLAAMVTPLLRKASLLHHQHQNQNLLYLPVPLATKLLPSKPASSPTSTNDSSSALKHPLNHTRKPRKRKRKRRKPLWPMLVRVGPKAQLAANQLHLLPLARTQNLPRQS